VLGFQRASLETILEKLRITYCGNVGVEFMHIQDPAQKSWVQQRVENAVKPTIDRKKILTELTRAEFFEKFLTFILPKCAKFAQILLKVYANMLSVFLVLFFIEKMLILISLL
jgi:2-oxoglutarate dehydrogenase complex dehydrogenase (E1) component-like enzyme